MSKHKKSGAAEVYLVGLGIPEVAALTLEAVAALKKCRVVFSAGAGSRGGTLLDDLCPDLREIPFDYGKKDQDREVKSKLDMLFRELAHGGPVGFVAMGHPMFYEVHSHWIKDRCEAENIPCRVISGISTFDAAFSALGVDLNGEDGLQAGDIGFFSRVALDTSAYVLIFRPGLRPEEMRRFLAKCLTVYPPAHKLAFVQCYNSGSTPARIKWYGLKSAAAKLSELGQFTSVLIPPAGRAVRRGL